MKETINILLVDDHPILMAGIKSLLENQEGLTVAGLSKSGEEAVEKIKNLDVDLAILDYDLPGMNGLELIKHLKELSPEIKLIMLSMYDEWSVIKEAMEAGADGYILKKDTHNSIEEAVKKVMNGKRYLSEEVAEIMLQGQLENQEAVQLTPREKEIVQLIARDQSNKQIAAQLFISERTVETHRKNILRKTNTNNAVALINYAREKRIL